MGNPTADIHQEEVTHTLHSDRVLTTDVGDDGFGGRRRLWRATTALAGDDGFGGRRRLWRPRPVFFWSLREGLMWDFLMGRHPSQSQRELGASEIAADSELHALG